MVMNNSLGAGIKFGQHEPLIARIKNLIHDYPEGIGILKELIQNADDAGATCIEIIFDWRTHSFSTLPNPRMAALMGPAMLVYNDATFSDQDFEGIQTLGVSKKREDLQKTGRFGVGFNAVYHVTDYPNFISRDRIAFFDPHADVIPEATRTDAGGCWEFAKAGWWNFPDFMRIYEPGRLQPGSNFFNGTLFRFALRTPSQAARSEIRSQPFTQDNVEELLAEFNEMGEELLLFLKSIVKIRIREIQPDGTSRDLIAIITQNPNEVSAEREVLRSPLHGDVRTLITQCKTNPNLSVSYLHHIETIVENRRTTSTWRICSLLRIDKANQIESALKQLAEQGQKAIPWAGVAACIARTNAADIMFVGRAYCFLPLPLKTRLPVHINGFFDLDSSRRELMHDQLTGRDKARGDWNQALIRHVLAHAYAQVITNLVVDLGEADPKQFYAFLPTNADGAFSGLPSYVFSLLKDRSIFRSAVPHPQMTQARLWIKPTEIKLLPEAWQTLAAPLRVDNIALPEPAIPPAVQKAFERIGSPLKIFTPADLRSHLSSTRTFNTTIEKAPRPSLRNREWIIQLLRYCLHDGHRDVRNLPLALLADNTLCTFGSADHKRLYDANSSLREIFANHPDWFLAADLVKQVPTLRQCKGVTLMNEVEMAQRLADVVDAKKKRQVSWQPDAEAIPNADWLAEVYSYLATLEDLPRDQLRAVPCVPGNDGRLHCPGYLLTPLWVNSTLDQSTLEAFRYFQIPLVEASGSLLRAIETFLKRHPGTLIWNLTVPDLIDTLSGIKKFPQYHESHYKKLICFLASDQSCFATDDEDRKERLRNLPIYLTNSNQPTRLIDVYISGGYETPPIASSVPLLQLGVSDRQEWKPLFDYLEVPVLSRATLIQEHLAPNYANLSREEQLSVLTWIRNHFSLAQTELEASQQSVVQLRRLIQTTPLIQCTDGKLRAIERIYTPWSYNVVHQILGDRAATPDMQIYAKGLAQWQDFFTNMGMLTTPSADDLIVHVDRLIAAADQYGVEAVTEALLQFLKHIESNWQVLKASQVRRENQTFPGCLKSRAWLPPERRKQYLQRYPGYLIPADRLCCADEVHFIQNANLVASQKPLLRVQKELDKEMKESLGFVAVNVSDVVNHLKVLIQQRENTTDFVDPSSLHRSVTEIYRYLRNRLVNAAKEQNQRWLKVQLDGWSCVWDGERFWKPKHTFQENVAFFGKYRKRINNAEAKEIFQMLGQKESPDLADYFAFISELAERSNGEPLELDDADCAIKVLTRIWHCVLNSEDEIALSSLYLLDEKNLLLPAETILVPDAPWRLAEVRAACRMSLLHPMLYQHCIHLAKRAGSPSLSNDVIERYKALQETDHAPAQDLCRTWQTSLRCEEFRLGLLRLIADEHNIEVETKIRLDWLSQIHVFAVDEITTDLYFRETLIAENVFGDFYFDEQSSTFYIRCDREDKDEMKDYLIKSFNYQLGDYQLGKNLLALQSILETEPGRIQQRLDKKRIRAFLSQTTIWQDDLVEVEDNREDSSQANATSNESAEQNELHEAALTTQVPPQEADQATSIGIVSPQNSSAQQPANQNSSGLTQSFKPSDSASAKPQRSFTRGQGFGEIVQSRFANSRSSRSRRKQAENRTSHRSAPTVASSSSRRARLRTYVISHDSPSDIVDQEEMLSNQERSQIEQAGIAKVVDYERSQGRIPRDMNEICANYPGYDIESRDLSGGIRYIEVKSKRGMWNGQGVKLSRTQFHESIAKQAQFWLYVVEQAEHNHEFQIFKIQNPACRVDEFYYDDGWKLVALNDEPNSEGTQAGNKS